MQTAMAGPSGDPGRAGPDLHQCRQQEGQALASMGSRLPSPGPPSLGLRCIPPILLPGWMAARDKRRGGDKEF